MDRLVHAKSYFEMDDLRVPQFQETTIYIVCIYIYIVYIYNIYTIYIYIVYL